MLINKIGIEDIRNKAEHGIANNDDCKALLEYINESMDTEGFTDKVVEAVEDAISDSICQATIVNAVERAVLRLKL